MGRSFLYFRLSYIDPGTLLQINVAKAKASKSEIALIAILELIFIAIVGYFVIYLAISTPISVTSQYSLRLFQSYIRYLIYFYS